MADLNELADRLEAEADDLDQIEMIGGQSAGDADDLRAAAVHLRAYQRLLDAIGDPGPVAGLAGLLVEIANDEANWEHLDLPYDDFRREALRDAAVTLWRIADAIEDTP